MIITAITLRRILRAKRTWALTALPLLGVVVATVTLTRTFDVRVGYAHFTRGLLLPIIVGLVGLVIAASAVTDERDELTILYLAQTPVARWRAVAEIWLGAWVATTLLSALPVIMAVVLLGKAEQGVTAMVAVVGACVLAAGAYTALGVLAALWTRRAAIVGLVYVLLLESIVSGFAAGARNLSVAQHGRAIAAAGLDSKTWRELAPPSTGTATSVVVLVVVTAAALVLAGRRLHRMNLP